MSWTAWFLILGTAGLCWRLGRRVEALERALREARYETTRLRSEGNDRDRTLTVLRAHVAALAAGQRVTRDQVMSGRFYAEAPAAEAYARFREQPTPLLLDVRTPDEWMADHAIGATLVPLDELPGRLGELPPKDHPVLVICASGARSLQAAELLATSGWSDVTSVAGGTAAWPGPRERRTMMNLSYSPPGQGRGPSSN